MEAWTTENLPPHRQYKAWRERLMAGANPAQAKRNESDDAPFSAQIKLSRIGSCDLLSVKAPPHWVELRSRTSAGANNYFAVHLLAPALFGTARSRMQLPAGSILMVDPNKDETLESTRDIQYVSIRIPRKLLDAYVPPHHWADHVIPLRPQDPVGSLVSSYAAALLPHAAEFAAPHVDTVVDTLCRLLALGITGGHPDRTDDKRSVRSARLVRIKRIIDASIGDPELSPSSLAASLRMSIRNLHLLFHANGETCAAYVLARRLEACRTALADPMQASRSVTDIAFAHGFNNLSTFYRAFRAAYDATPLETRAWSGSKVA
jgi:AraC family transcriptional regulator, positive regulator of tynA and feaB